MRHCRRGQDIIQPSGITLICARWQRQCKEKIMCGIVGAIAARNMVPILIEGLKRLEYRGYDSAGIAGLPAMPSAVYAVSAVWPKWKPPPPAKPAGTLGIAPPAGPPTAV
jgi:hypothetical protein